MFVSQQKSQIFFSRNRKQPLSRKGIQAPLRPQAPGPRFSGFHYGLSMVHFEVLRFFRSLYGRVREFSEFRVLIWSYNFKIRSVDPGACIPGKFSPSNFQPI